MSKDILKTVVREEAVLEKFDGEADDPEKVLRERITLLNGSIVNHEFFDEAGELTHSEGGNYNGTNNSI
jgi:hypothetical protein